MEHSPHEILSHLDRGPGREKFLQQDRLLEVILSHEKLEGKQSRSHGSYSSRKTKKYKALYTQLLNLYPGLLDDLSPGMMKIILNRCHQWDFNAFLLDRFSGGRSLSTLCLHIFHSTGLISSFGLDPADLCSFFRVVERGYHSSNPYHTSIHACDVTQAIYVFCQHVSLVNHLTKVELLATLVAAMCHDLDHPGVNEKFLVSTGSHLAVLYDNVSVLENHHWRSAIACFVESGLGKYLSESQFSEFTDLVRSLILATDISRQQEFLTQFRYFLDTSDRDISQTNNRHFILQIAIKCADISNPCRSWPVSRVWSLRACEEFFRQGDRERDLGFLLTPICDRFNVTVAKVQVGFYSFVAEPLFKEWDRFLNSALSSSMMMNLYHNQAIWEKEVLQEEMTSVEVSTKATIEECPPIPNIVTPKSVTNSSSQCSHRRLSLPATDPLHRIFDQMTQPDYTDLPKTAHLRRNFSLTDRRRSSLLRGLYNRNSLKPVRGRCSSRPNSVCLESNPRTLQSKENRLPEQSSMDSNLDSADLDPCGQLNTTELEKENAFLRLALKSCLAKRRGSAPSNLILGDSLSSSNSNILGHNNQNSPNMLLQHQQACLAANNRRGSLPSDLLNNSLPKQLRNRVLPTSASGGKRPSLLRRRSMGTELLSLGNNLGNQSMKERQLVQKYLNRPF